MGGKAARHDDFDASVDVIAEDLFTDRTEPRKAFWDVYSAMQDGCYEVLSYYGVGGIGKTTLLKQLAKEMDEDKKKKADHLFFSFEGRSSKEDFLFTVSRMLMLSHKGLKCPLFDTAFQKMLLEEGKNVSMYEDQMQRKLSENPVVDSLLSMAGDFLPGLGGAVKLLENTVLFCCDKISDAEKKNGSNARYYDKIQSSNNVEIRKDLHRYLVRDIEETLNERTRPFVFFIDGYENYVDIREQGLVNPELEVDYWLKNEANGFVILPNTIWVVAGREQLHWPTSVLAPENMHRIGNLSEIDAEAFLVKAGVVDQQLIPSLYKLTDGMPAFMDLCVDTYRGIVAEGRMPMAQDFGQNTSELARRYLDKMPEDMRNIILMLSAFPNVWDRKFAEKVATEVGYASYIPAIDKVLNLSLVDKVAKGYRLHETIRKIVKDYLAPDMQDRIEEAIVSQHKDILLSLTEGEYREEAIRDFVESLATQSDMVISDEDIMRIADIIQSEFTMVGNFTWGHEVLVDLIKYVESSNAGPEARIRCRTVYGYNLYRCRYYEELTESALATYELACEQLGREHRETLRAMANLATAYYCVDKDEKAMKLDEECLEIRRRVLGQEDPDTLDSMNALAVTYGSLKRHAERRALLEECYELRAKILGSEHPKTLQTLNNLGRAYGDLGLIEKAKQCFARCLEARQRVLGASHPEIAISARNLQRAKSTLVQTNKSSMKDAFGGNLKGGNAFNGNIKK